MLKEIKKAFTLAEVLIVIGIIGVVAALTLPNLNHATGDKEKVTKVKKIYSALSEAYGRAEAIYGPADTWFNNLESGSEEAGERFAKRVTEFMKVSKDCGFDEGCFSSAPSYFLSSESQILDGYDNFESMLAEQHYMVTLSDGTSLGFRYNAGNYLEIIVDIDGPNKGKNFEEDDIHAFYLGLNQDDDGNSIYFPYDQLVPYHYYNNGDFRPYGTWWIINFDNMDYLKCPDELDWEAGVTSCK